MFGEKKKTHPCKVENSKNLIEYGVHACAKLE